LSIALPIIKAAECNGAPSPDAQRNLNPIDTAEPVFVRSVDSGMLFTAGSGDDKISIVHLWGSPYERGYAHGELMQDVASDFVEEAMSYFED
jgi:hypothetical protein